MSHEIKLDVFTIKLKKVRKAELIPFSKFFNADPDDPAKLEGFKAFFKAYVTSFGDSFAASKEIGKAIYLSKGAVKFDSSKSIIYGLADGGTTGIGSSIQSKKNISRSKPYPVTRDKVNSMPYYFIIWTPKDSNVGLLILQSYGNKSINDIFKEQLKYFFSTVCKDVALVYGNHVPKEAVDKMKANPVVNEVVLRKYNLPSTKGEKLLGVNYAYDKSVTVEIKISGLKGIPEMAQKIKDYTTGTIAQLIDVEELYEIGFDGDHDTFLKFEHNGKTALGKMKDEKVQISPSYYVDKADISSNEHLHPEFESIHAYCCSFLEKMQQEIGYKKI